jgi:MFS family permease
MSVAVPVPRRSPHRSPRVARLLGLSMVARTPEGAASLLFILQIRALGGSYSLAGAVAAVLAVGLATGAPLLGRLMDRRGQAGVLRVSATVAASAVAIAGLVPHGVTPAVLLPLALIAGVAMPPIAPCLRALLGRVVTDPEARHGAMALDSALQEISFMAGPLVFVTALAAFSPAAGLVAAAAALLLGTVAFAATPEAREVPADPGARPRGGALVSHGVRTLLLVAAGAGVTYGAVEVALAAVSEHHGGDALLGLLFAIWGIPSLLAGLVVARRPAPADAVRTLVAYVFAVGASTVLLAVAPSVWTLMLLLAASGAFAAPMFATLYGLVNVVAAQGTVTEAFTWLGSGLFAGLGLGGALAGALINAAGIGAAFAAAGAIGVLAAGLAAARGSTLRQRPTTAPSPAVRGTAMAPSRTGSVAASDSSAKASSVARPHGSSTRRAAAACTAAAMPAGPSKVEAR